MIEFDVIIVGSGPSGSMAAYYLAKKGISVAILEKENLPRYKTCGGGLVWRGRKIIPFDVSSVVKSEFNQIDVLFYGQNLKLQSKRDFPVISMVMRDDFDYFLTKKAIDEGAKIYTNTKITKVETVSEKCVLFSDNNQFQCKFVVASDGVYSQIAKQSGWIKDTRTLIPAIEYEIEVGNEDWKNFSKSVRFDIDFISNGYAWVFPKLNHLSIGLTTTKKSKIDLKNKVEDYINYLGIKDVKSKIIHGFQIPIKSRKDGFFKNNVLLTGDAAGLADPITAEGISNALLSGKLAAESILEGNFDKIIVEKVYTQKLNDFIVQEFKTASYLSNLFYNKVKIRNILIQKYGDVFCEYMTDIFSGDKKYPKDIVKKFRKKIIGF